MKQITEKQKRERKFLLALPLLTLPFLCLAFWALGGGKGTSDLPQKQPGGLNISLPEAHVDSLAPDKLASYERSERRAAQKREQMRMDPFARVTGPRPDTTEHVLAGLERKSTLMETENAVSEKLSDLEALLQPSEEPLAVTREAAIPEGEPGKAIAPDPELQHLESMMSAVMAPAEDPEMEKIDQMLDKLLDVQHPGRVQQRLNQEAELLSSKAFEVSLSPEESTELEVRHAPKPQNRFYSLEKKDATPFSDIRPAIPARVTVDQEIVSGASIRMELSRTVYIKGVEFLAGTPVTGVCRLNGERLHIQVEAIRSDNLIIPVDLTVTGLDALPGIRIPNTITRDAVKQGAGDGVQSLNMMSMSGSWEAQASMAGLETVKGIFSKKAKLIRVHVKAGHPLLLTDQSIHR